MIIRKISSKSWELMIEGGENPSQIQHPQALEVFQKAVGGIERDEF